MEAGGGKVITLLYHDVVEPGEFSSSGFSSVDADIYKFARPDFEHHLEAIDHTFAGRVILLDGPAAGEGPSDSLVLTFDDGGASALSPIADLLEVRGWRGHFFIATNYIGQPGFLTAAQIRELRGRGHVVGSHSCSHPARMSSCPRRELDREWGESARVLSDILGEGVRVASVPGGFYSREVASAAAGAGTRVLFNSEPVVRVETVDGCLIVGRYSVQPGVSAATAARIAVGAWSPRARQYLYWNAKKVLKRLGGNQWIAFRKAFLAWKSGGRSR